MTQKDSEIYGEEIIKTRLYTSGLNFLSSLTFIDSTIINVVDAYKRTQRRV